MYLYIKTETEVYLWSHINFQTHEERKAPMKGARINIHNCESASPPANNAGAILRAGLTEVPVIGMQQI